MKTSSDNENLKVKEVAKILNLHPETVKGLIRKNDLPAFKPGGHEWRIKAIDLEEWMEKKKEKVKRPAFDEVTEFKSDDYQNLLKGGATMKVKKVTVNRWFAGFGGFFWKKDSKGIKRWYIWWYDGNGNRPHKAVELVTDDKEALIALKYELEQERKKAFIKKYLPDQAEELSEELGLDDSDNNSVKLEKMCDDWLENYAKLNKKNPEVDECVVRYWNEKFGRKKVKEISKGDFIRHFAEEQKEAKNMNRDVEKVKATQHHRGAILRSIFNWAIKTGDYGVKVNPVEDTLPKSRKKEREPFKKEELRLLFQKASESCRHLLPVMAYATVTGGRIGELENLKWENVNLEEGWIKLVGTKEGKSKIIDIDSDCALYQMFMDMKKSQKGLDERDFKDGDYDYVFTYWNPRYAKYGRIPIQDHFLELRRMAGIEGKTFHSFRHTAGSMASNNGASSKAVQAIYGHSTIDMTQHYLHASREAKLNVVKTVEKQLNIGKLLNGNEYEVARLPQGN
jgi:excisionase family DNA binding protein